MTTFYVSGKMRGVPRFNFPQFDSLSAHLRRQGDVAINPADHDRATDPLCEMHENFASGTPRTDTEHAMHFKSLIGWDLAMIASPEVDAIVLLPGWEDSEGARHERYVAEACHKPVWLAHLSDLDGWYLTLDDVQRRLAGAEFDQPKVDATVIGLMGYAQVGKDTLAQELVTKHGFTRIAFADNLRDCLYALNPIVILNVDTTAIRVQDLVNAVGWDEAKVRYPEIRALLQRLGTEVGREILGNDIWVDTALAKVKPGGKYVITDMRFPNELAAVVKLGGKTVRILREGYGPVNDHWSETALDGYDADVTLINDRRPTDLLTGLIATVTA